MDIGKGKQQEAVIRLLAEDERAPLSISQIAEKLGITDLRLVSSPVKLLAKHKLIGIQGNETSEKGRDINLWGLTDIGQNYAFTLGIDVKKMLKIYNKTGGNELTLIIIEFLEEMLGEAFAQNQQQFFKELGELSKKGAGLNTKAGFIVDFLIQSGLKNGKLDCVSKKLWKKIGNRDDVTEILRIFN